MTNNSNTNETVGIAHAQYDKGHTPEWVLVQTPAAALAEKYGCTIEDVRYHFEGRSEQSGYRSLQDWKDSCARDDALQAQIAVAMKERGEYRTYLLERAYAAS